MEFDRIPLVCKDLLEVPASSLAGINVCERDKESIRPVRCSPANTKTFLFRGSKLDEDVARTRNFLFHSTTQCLQYYVSPHYSVLKVTTHCYFFHQPSLDIFWEIFLNKKLDRKPSVVDEYRLQRS